MANRTAILEDLVLNQPEPPEGKAKYTVADLTVEFDEELNQFDQGLISETELYEIMCAGIDRHDF